MEVVGHQAAGMNLSCGFLTRLGQGFEKVLPIHVIQKDVFAAVATAHHMINGIGIFDSDLARHFRDKRSFPRSHESRNEPCYGLTPLWVDPFTPLGRVRPGEPGCGRAWTGCGVSRLPSPPIFSGRNSPAQPGITRNGPEFSRNKPDFVRSSPEFDRNSPEINRSSPEAMRTGPNEGRTDE